MVGEDDKKRTIANRDWWQSLLPSGWLLYGWTYRTRAQAVPPNSTRIVQLDAELLCALNGLDYKKEIQNAV